MSSSCADTDNPLAYPKIPLNLLAVRPSMGNLCNAPPYELLLHPGRQYLGLTFHPADEYSRSCIRNEFVLRKEKINKFVECPYPPCLPLVVGNDPKPILNGKVGQTDQLFIQEDNTEASIQAVAADQSIPADTRGIAVADLHQPLGMKFVASARKSFKIHRPLLYHRRYHPTSIRYFIFAKIYPATNAWMYPVTVHKRTIDSDIWKLVYVI